MKKVLSLILTLAMLIGMVPIQAFAAEDVHTHDYVPSVTLPTCTEKGYTTYSCECGDSYIADYVDATEKHNYENGVCSVCSTAASPYLQQLPESFSGCTDLYDMLSPVKGYYTAAKYDTSNGDVLSVVIPVEPGDRIAASSFGPVSENKGSVDGIRVTYLLGDQIVTSLSAGDVYNGYMENGYITVPDGVDAVCIPWWKPMDSNWLTLARVRSNYAAHSPEPVPAQEPTCTENGYTAGEICEYCGISMGTRVEIPATGHTYDADTCTTCGKVNVLAVLDGKYVSILGDSISTFNGYSNDAAVNTTIGANAPRYDAGTADTKPGSYCLLASVDDTWWMDVANRSGMKLLVNNSWAGSQVFGGQTSDGRQIPPAYLDRCVNLHDNTVSNNPNNAPVDPDVIFVYLGINDYNFNRSNVGTGAVDYAKLVNSDGSYVTPATFGEAYGILLHKMRSAYPNAQIFAMTLLPENLYSVDLTAWEQHNAYIRASAEYYDIPLVDLAEKCAITWDNYSGYMIDKIHPTTAGMELIADCVEAELQAYYLAHEHNYTTAVTPPTCTEQGYTTYTCECGDSYMSDYLEELGHTPVVDPGIKENSARPGMTEGSHCATCGEVLEAQQEIPVKGYDWMLEDGEFKLLLIGNSFSQDASSCGFGMTESQLYNMLQAMLGEDVKVTLGLLYSGGKGVHWYATQTEQGTKTPGFYTISPEKTVWVSRGGTSTETALTWTDWDVVTLQPYDVNFTKEQEGVPEKYKAETDEKFYPLETATEYMLDFIGIHAPQADVYCYMHWARSSATVASLNASLSTYQKFADFYPKGLDYLGTETGNRYTSIIPVGLSIQNARTTYLSTLSYNIGASVDLQNDPQIGLQRDGGHVTFNVGRYIAGLTFAEMLIPQALRVDGYVLPGIRVTESVGELPREYTQLAQQCVTAAVDSWKNGSLTVTNMDGYAEDPVVAARETLESMTLNLNCGDQDAQTAQIKANVLSALPADFAVDAVVIDPEQNTAAVTVRFGYSSVTVDAACSDVKHTYTNGVCIGCGAVDLDAAEPMSMQYDDHLDVTGKTVEILDAGVPTSYQVGYGVEENKIPDTAVVTMKGNTLVAAGIGSATVMIDGKLYEITVTAAPISLLLIIGQSNAEGMEGNASQSIICDDGQVYSTYAESNGLVGDAGLTVENAGNYVPSALTGASSTVNVNGTTTKLSDYPVNSLTTPGTGKYGMDSGLAYEWIRQTGEKVWVVNAAHGASSITTWQKNAENYDQAVALFQACQQVLKAEIAAGHYTFSHMGYYWNQGCADETKTAEWYVSRYLDMHDHLKIDLACDMDSNSATADNTLEFGSIVLVQAGHSTASGYRTGTYEDTSDNFFMTYKELELRGPRVAQIWMANNPDLPDIHIVSTLAQDWVTMPDGSDGVAEYFQSAYPNGTVDYRTQVNQSASWYRPTTPAAVKDSIHYNQIGYNEIGRESARNTLYILGILQKPDVETKVTFLNWTGYELAETVKASITGTSDTLVVPLVYPCYESKTVAYTLSDGISWNYYDLLDTGVEAGTLTASVGAQTVTVTGHEYCSYRFELVDGELTSVVNEMFRENTLTATGANTYTLSDSLVLMHNKEWMVEFNSVAANRFMALASSKSTTEGMFYFFKSNSGSGVLAIGEYKDGQYQNYGLLQSQVEIDWNQPHVYRFQNVINTDGANTIHIFIDGEWVGTATNLIINSKLQNTDNMYLSGKDFVFTNIGCSNFGFDADQMAYLVVYEGGRHTHTYTPTVTAPTCTEQGYTTYTCTCNDSYVESYTEATGHQHTEVRNACEATCTATGYTGDIYCLDCGKLAASGTQLAAKGHSWNSGVITQQATSTTDGIKTYTCYTCGGTKTEVIPAAKAKDVPSVSVSVSRADNSKLTITGKVDDFANIEDYYTITAHGLLYIQSSKIGNRVLNFNTAGRTKVNCSSYASDGSFSYTFTPSKTSTAYTVRAYITYTDADGNSVTVYSNTLRGSYNSFS